jgi:S1-C subfamily serine protease
MFAAVFKRSLAFLALLICTAVSPAAELERSVVQIITFSQEPQWDTPWRQTGVRRGSGTGFLIQGKRILTNAHVIGWARQILIRRHQDPQPYLAQVVFAGHDCDLALLEVEDPAFYEGLEPLEFGPLPKVQSTVITCGYPAGGEQVSFTRGVVSRIELQNFVHIGNRNFLAIQTDAAINPGNSGGPVFQDDRVVGVAFQGIPGLENAGFFIPLPVIEHFLTDVADGTYDGFPSAGIRITALHNPAYRRYLGLEQPGIGARVDGLLPIPATQDLLKPDDVLLQVGEFPIGSDGSVLFEGNRVFGGVAFQLAQNGESVPLKIWRDGKQINVQLPVGVYEGDNLLSNHYDTPPRYYVHAGLVFTPLSLDYLKTQGRNWRDNANNEIVYEMYYRRQEAPETARTEPIVLSAVLTHPVNVNLRYGARSLVDSINGVRIDRLEDVIKAFNNATNSHHVLEFLPNRALETIDRQAAAEAHQEILRTYAVPNDRRL